MRLDNRQTVGSAKMVWDTGGGGASGWVLEGGESVQRSDKKLATKKCMLPMYEMPLFSAPKLAALTLVFYLQLRNLPFGPAIPALRPVKGLLSSTPSLPFCLFCPFGRRQKLRHLRHPTSEAIH